jgi:hypothetical protein
MSKLQINRPLALRRSCVPPLLGNRLRYITVHEKRLASPNSACTLEIEGRTDRWLPHELRGHALPSVPYLAEVV